MTDEFDEFADADLPSYVGSTAFQKLPLCATGEALARARPQVAIVGAPYDGGASHRPGARFGPRAIRAAY